MAQRKLQQEIDKCFKRVGEGIQAFESIFDKIQQTSNASQKEKLEDALKREIKKLQRQRDQIKTWAAGNEIKDKKPLLEQRKLIETQMEKFKAVEKEMKTKAYSKEGLSAAAKLDPKEKEKLEACQFLSSMVEELDRQVETLEAEAEALQATVKKGKKDTAKAERVAEIERVAERHKWHQSKLELALRSLENGALETDQVMALEESIKYYVENNQEVDFIEDEEIYDELSLEEDDDAFGIGNELDRISSHDAQSIQDDAVEPEPRSIGTQPPKTKVSSGPEHQGASARRPSTQMKSPLPALATLHTPLPSSINGASASNTSMKPAPLPTRPPGETLKYASAAAAAAASDKNGVGIAPLPPPPGAAPSTLGNMPGLAPLPPAGAVKASATTSPTAVNSQPVGASQPTQKSSGAGTTNTGDGVLASQAPTQSPALSSTSAVNANSAPSQIVQERPDIEQNHGSKAATQSGHATRKPSTGSQIGSGAERQRAGSKAQVNDGVGATQANGSSRDTTNDEADTNESVFHLPPGLQDLIQSFEATKSRVSQPPTSSVQRLLAASAAGCPDSLDADRPRHYKPQTRYSTPSHYPQEPLSIFDDSRLYTRIDTDTLFYVFYYRQGTYQQYLAAKSLKNQSWRFHKQYQTWFQRHEEPKTITEEFEQGTYRFFDYESTWMNRRKADFKFAYKFLEDDL
ncbi:MAG: general negative regulator of transcription subunit 5 [Piccolia ochrophora]|nr:MAG: general negative regulator of transcription subunit 5 [Piccolia ochrophora]